MSDEKGRVPSAPGSREPGSQAIPALSGFDPSRGSAETPSHTVTASFAGRQEIARIIFAQGLDYLSPAEIQEAFDALSYSGHRRKAFATADRILVAVHSAETLDRSAASAQAFDESLRGPGAWAFERHECDHLTNRVGWVHHTDRYRPFMPDPTIRNLRPLYFKECPPLSAEEDAR